MKSPINKPTLADLTAFAAVAHHLSFSRASEALLVSRSALSHTIISLERRLGQRLLTRTTRAVSLTDAGRELLRTIQPILQDLDQALDTFGEDHGSIRGTLRISAGDLAVSCLLEAVIPTYLERHPAMAVELVADNRFVDIVEQGFDAGVRFAEAVPKDMIAVPFAGKRRFIAVASPSYLRSAPPLNIPDDLRRHRCIRHRMPSGKPYRWEFHGDGEDIEIDAPGPLTLDNNRLMVEAAANGLGVAYVSDLAARSMLNEKRLVIVLADWSPPVPGLCLYYAGRRLLPAGLRAFIDVLKKPMEPGRSP